MASVIFSPSHLTELDLQKLAQQRMELEGETWNRTDKGNEGEDSYTRMSNEKNLGCLGYIYKDVFLTQLYREYNRPI